jgi:hypothetical protein
VKIRITNDNFISEQLGSPQIGAVHTVRDDFGRHLIDIGVAVAADAPAPDPKKKAEEPDEPSSALPAAPASVSTTAPRRKDSRKKPSR